MSITFAYPTIANPTVSVVLDDIEGYPHTRPWRIFQSAFDTDAATQVVYDHGDPYQAVPLTLYPLTTAEVNALIKFFKNTVKGRALSFEIQDTAGDIYPVNFAQDVIDPMQTNIGIWSINIVLRVVSRISQYLVHMPLESNLDLVAGSGDVTFTRSTIGTYTENGVVKTAAINAPRFEENGLFMEGASTNVLLYSEDLSNGVWSGTVVAPVTDGTLGPDGVTQAWKVEDDDNAVSEYLVNTVMTGGYAIGDHNGSFYLKAGTSIFCRVNFRIYGSTTYDEFSYLNLITGTSSNSDFTTEQLANGWWRIHMPVTNADAANAYSRVLIYPATAAAVLDDTVTGYVYCIGAQIEALPFVSSYIKTTSSAATRTADFCSIQFSGNHPSIQKGNSFSYIVDADTEDLSFSATRAILAAGFPESGINDFSVLQIDNASTNVLYYRGASGVGFSGADLGSLTRYGVTVDGDELVSTYLDSDPSISATHSLADDTGINATNISIGCATDGTLVLYGHVKNLRIYDVSLHPVEMRYA